MFSGNYVDKISKPGSFGVSQTRFKDLCKRVEKVYLRRKSWEWSWRSKILCVLFLWYKWSYTQDQVFDGKGELEVNLQAT